MTPEAARMVQTPPTRAPLQVCCPTGAWERLSRARAREDQRGRMSAEGLLAALLDVSADELLGVLFQYRVDLVQQVLGARAPVEQRADVRPGTTQRLHHRYPHQRLPPHVEDH